MTVIEPPCVSQYCRQYTVAPNACEPSCEPKMRNAVIIIHIQGARPKERYFDEYIKAAFTPRSSRIAKLPDAEDPSCYAVSKYKPTLCFLSRLRAQSEPTCGPPDRST